MYSCIDLVENIGPCPLGPILLTMLSVLKAIIVSVWLTEELNSNWTSKELNSNWTSKNLTVIHCGDLKSMAISRPCASGILRDCILFRVKVGFSKWS